jgi:hypothetical protein
MSHCEKSCKCKALKAKHSTATVYFEETSFVECAGIEKIDKVMVNEFGPLVHVNLYEDGGKFYTTGTPAKFSFNLPVQSKVVQQSAGIVIFSTAGDNHVPEQIGTSSGDVAIHVDSYITGTVSQNGKLVTGVGTNFLSTMVGGKIKFVNGKCAKVIGYVSPSSLVVDKVRDIPLQTFKLNYSYARVYLIGPPLESSAPDRSQLTIDFTYITHTN